ncbi:MAG TPA: hypothetical protein VF178_04175 [Gemmatimonadaceae bacterium]
MSIVLMSVLWLAGVVCILMGARNLPRAGGFACLSFGADALGVLNYKAPQVVFFGTALSESAQHAYAGALLAIAFVAALAALVGYWRAERRVRRNRSILRARLLGMGVSQRSPSGAR